MVENKQKSFPPVHRASSSSSLRTSEAWHEMERINVQSIKDHIAKRVGIEKAKRYFSHFRRFLGSGLSKPKLDKLVVKTIGKENVSLHNQLVRAILSNAVRGKVSPIQSVQNPHSKPPLIPTSPCVTSEDTIHYASPSALVSNGDSFLPSPRRGRSLRDHKASLLGPREDHSHSAPDFYRSTQQLDGAKPDKELNRSVQPPTKRAKAAGITGLTVPSGENGGLLTGEAKEDALLYNNDNSSLLKERREEAILCDESDGFPKERRDDALPPFFPFGSLMSALQSSHRRVLPEALPPHVLQEEFGNDCSDARKLPDGETMHMYMEQMVETEGLEGVSRDCADILNVALDAYLTRIIRSYTSAIRSQKTADTDGSSDRSGKGGPKADHRRINGVRPVQYSMVENLKKDEEKIRSPISLTEFKIAMDLNPQLLGGEWAAQLEKISFRAFDLSNSPMDDHQRR